ncbi:Crp/Fnr family transcriptional regulator [Flammeovirga sp. EKP202]|uniref:Crp/Fnr family transcriptional regulator n=1 Tax=Flammeovirga sp. EKP202 TaxID=2770592 RepID=UPI00165F6E6F|nr:Crp/Fnr family transcriptional regulator [Flammeovirga sp. EKP202]MBD0405300.1 Crp/Fnr family transcriptional regulator [Flammeovirga sp. EKP202]
MLRENQAFLAYIEGLYQQQERKDKVIKKHYSEGQKLLNQDEKPTKVILIKDGITKCFFAGDNDKEYLFEFLGQGEIVGEVEFIKKRNCLCSIEAITEVTAYAISIDYFSKLIKTDLQLNNLLLDVFAERIINTSTRASYQQLYTIEHTLSRLLTLQSEQNLSISKENMASYLGVTVRSLNRALKKEENKKDFPLT